MIYATAPPRRSSPQPDGTSTSGTPHILRLTGLTTKERTMATSPPDGSGLELTTPDVPYPSPDVDVSRDKVKLASLSYDLLGLSISIDPESLSQSLEHLLSSIEDDDYQAPEHAARARRSTEGRSCAVLSRPQVANKLGIISELLKNPGDSHFSAPEFLKDLNLPKASREPSTSESTKNGISGRTVPRYPHIFPQNSDQISVTSLQTFETALSSTGSYATAPSGPRAVSHVGRWTASDTEEWIAENKQPRIQHVVRDIVSSHEPFSSQWLLLLILHNLILDPKEALDWSGRGQHVEYSPEEQESIPLVSKGNLGYGASGIVDRVRCRRIDLARKTIRCIRKPTREEAAKEVRHLQQLQHRHVVRLVGTYMLKKNLSILMYPATEYSLEGFLDMVHDKLSCLQVPDILRYSWCSRLLRLIACLINAIAFIHAQNTKHMDIKPSNILVDYSTKYFWAKVYITDFGIARSYQSREESFTDSPISYTRIYTAPEVVQQTTRGPPADIFSLGCVFVEILATLLSTEGDCQQEQLRQIREGGTDNSYQANITNVIGWFESVKADLELCLCHLGRQCYHQWAHILPGMLSIRPEDRPTAVELKQHTQDFACVLCDAGPEPFEAAT